MIEGVTKDEYPNLNLNLLILYIERDVTYSL